MKHALAGRLVGFFASRPFIVFLLAFLVDLGFSAVNFGVPLYAYGLGAPEYLIGLIASALGLSYIFSAYYSPKIVFGRVLGRTIALLVASYAGIAAIYLVAGRPELFVAIRCVEGFVLGNLYPLTDTLPAPSRDGRNLVPWYNAGWALSYIVAPPLLGLLISMFGFTVPFVFAALSSLAALGVVLASAEKLGLNARTPKPELAPLRGSIVVGEVALPAFVCGFVTAVFSSLYPAYLASQNYGYVVIGVIVGVMAASRTVVLAAAGKMQESLGLGRLKSLGYALSAAIALPTLLHGVLEQFVCAVAVGAGVGLLYHVGLSSSLRGEEGYYTNTLEASLGTGFFSGPLFGAAISGFGAGYVYAGVSLLPLATLMRNIRRGRRAAPQV